MRWMPFTVFTTSSIGRVRVVLDGLGGSARILHLDEDGRKHDIRHALDAQAVVGEDAQDEQRHHHHGGEDGLVDAGLGDPHGRQPFFTSGGAGPASFRLDGGGRADLESGGAHAHADAPPLRPGRDLDHSQLRFRCPASPRGARSCRLRSCTRTSGRFVAHRVGGDHGGRRGAIDLHLSLGEATPPFNAPSRLGTEM